MGHSGPIIFFPLVQSTNRQGFGPFCSRILGPGYTAVHRVQGLLFELSGLATISYGGAICAGLSIVERL